MRGVWNTAGNVILTTELFWQHRTPFICSGAFVVSKVENCVSTRKLWCPWYHVALRRDNTRLLCCNSTIRYYSIVSNLYARRCVISQLNCIMWGNTLEAVSYCNLARSWWARRMHLQDSRFPFVHHDDRIIRNLSWWNSKTTHKLYAVLLFMWSSGK